jgi:hypothetical protein
VVTVALSPAYGYVGGGLTCAIISVSVTVTILSGGTVLAFRFPNDPSVAPKAMRVADLGEQVAGDDGDDAEDLLQCEHSPVAAGQATELALGLRHLLLDRVDIAAYASTSAWTCQASCGSSSQRRPLDESSPRREQGDP